MKRVFARRDNPMKFKTVRQRRAVYSLLVKYCNATDDIDKWAFTFCGAVIKLCASGDGEAVDIYAFPELYISGPKNKLAYWYPRDTEGFKKRVACLKRAIEKCDKIIRTTI